MTAAEIYSNANNKKMSRTNYNTGAMNTIAANNAPPSPPKGTDEKVASVKGE